MNLRPKIASDQNYWQLDILETEIDISFSLTIQGKLGWPNNIKKLKLSYLSFRLSVVKS
jgi:hypothetical protein